MTVSDVIGTVLVVGFFVLVALALIAALRDD